MKELPPLVLLEEMPGRDSTEKWRLYLDCIYEVFCCEVANAQLKFRGLPVRCRYHEPYDGKHFSFWHLISEGRIEEDRTPDLERCCRIKWIGWIIGNADDSVLIRSWETERSTRRGRRTRIPLWLYSEDYVVILEKRANFYLLITSYCVLPGQKKKFEKEWADWIAYKAEAAGKAASDAPFTHGE